MSEPPLSLQSADRLLGAAALVLGIITLVVAVGILSYAAIRYAPIAKATSISAGEGPDLSPLQEQVSASVVYLKVLSLQLEFILGVITLALSVSAIALSRGIRYARRALVVLSTCVVATIVISIFAFPIFPCLGNVWCHGG